MTIARPFNLINNWLLKKYIASSSTQRLSKALKIALCRQILCLLTIFLASLFAASSSMAYDEDIPITTDNRIKTYIYNPNEVYLLVLHFGYQSHIEFAKGEEIQTISLGNSYAWKITPLANRLFIKPLEKNMRTNMTIITNKRTYQFDIVSQELEMGEEKDLVYVVRFYYPKRKAK